VSAIRYSLIEAASSLWRRRGASSLAVITIAAAMAIPGGFAVAMRNVDTLLTRWQESAELSVFLQDGAGRDQIGTIERHIEESGLAAGRVFISKAEALRRFLQMFPDLGAVAASLEDNPLPASIEVRLRPGLASGDDVERLVARLDRLEGVADVRADRHWLARLGILIRIARALGFVITALLVVAAAFTVANVVRLAAIARWQEIEIMQLVGAPAVYVRGPFVAEGVLQGGAGALVAVVLLWAMFVALRLRYGTPLANALGLSGLSFLTVGTAAALVVGGMAIGCIGGYIAARGVRTT
jgi:cell division transport system permease protein